MGEPERPGGDNGAQPRAVARLVSRAVQVVRRCPVTATVIVSMLVIGVASGAFTKTVETSGLLETVGYGAPALKQLHLFGFVAGMFFAIQPYMYVTIIGVIVRIGSLTLTAVDAVCGASAP